MCIFEDMYLAGNLSRDEFPALASFLGSCTYLTYMKEHLSRVSQPCA